jgi:hypothetical protein
LDQQGLQAAEGAISTGGTCVVAAREIEREAVRQELAWVVAPDNGRISEIKVTE